jgi:hypothetical protein
MKTAGPLEGHEAGLCGARLRQTDGRCRKTAGWGTNHVGEGPCRLHGGSTRSVSKGANLRLVEREARDLFGKIAPESVPVDNPLAAYAELAGRVLAWLQLMDSLLDGLRSVGYASETAGEQTRAVVQLYERAMDRANTVLGSYARLRIDDRLATITERQADMVVRALDAVIAHAGLTGPAAIEARKVGAAQLRVVGQ